MRYLAIILSIVFFFGCETSTDPEQPIHKMYLSPGSATISVGGQSEISLKIQNIPDPVFGMSLQLDYNNTILVFSDSLGLSEGEFFGQNVVVFVKEENSKIYLTFSKIQNESLASGSGTICTLTFTGISAGSSVIQLTQNIFTFYDSAGETITMSDLTYVGTAITVQ